MKHTTLKTASRLLACRDVDPPCEQRATTFCTLHAALAPLDRPSVVVWGAHDRFLRVDQAREQLRSFPNAEVTVLSDSGHYAHLDDPARVADIVVPFLRAQVGKTGNATSN